MKTLSRKHLSILLLFLSTATIALAQEVVMVEYDFVTRDSTIINFGESPLSQEEASTANFIGPSQNVTTLDTSLVGGNFVRLQNVDQTTTYPISTAVRLLSIGEDGEPNICSGTMVSSRHILTSAFCFLERGNHSFDTDSIMVFPGFNNGAENPIFGAHLVSKAYTFLDWNVGTDFLILELDDDVGVDTGWLGVAYDDNDDELRDQIYHKYSYPAFARFTVFDGDVNGDTLYYSYGLYDRVDNYIGTSFPDPEGFIGEAGSPIFLANDNDGFRILGTFTWSSFLHSRIRELEFWGMLNVIEPFLTTATEDIENNDFEIYPNPADNQVNIELENAGQDYTLTIYSELGVSVYNKEVRDKVQIDLTQWPVGLYHAVLKREDRVQTASFVKYIR